MKWRNRLIRHHKRAQKKRERLARAIDLRKSQMTEVQYVVLKNIHAISKSFMLAFRRLADACRKVTERLTYWAKATKVDPETKTITGMVTGVGHPCQTT